MSPVEVWGLFWFVAYVVAWAVAIVGMAMVAGHTMGLLR